MAELKINNSITFELSDEDFLLVQDIKTALHMTGYNFGEGIKDLVHGIMLVIGVKGPGKVLPLFLIEITFEKKSMLTDRYINFDRFRVRKDNKTMVFELQRHRAIVEFNKLLASLEVIT